MLLRERLRLGLLVGRDHELARVQQLPSKPPAYQPRRSRCIRGA
jgi:hypothetical protein